MVDTITERNRKNAKKSTGPRTETGKAKSAMNSLQHGATSNRLVTPGEDPARSQALVQSFERSLSLPQDLASEVAKELAGMVVREERIERLETALEREAVAAAEDFDRYDETAVIAQLERQVRACNEVQGITRSDAYPPQDDSLRKATLLIDGFRTIIAQCPTGENEESLSALRDLSAVLTARSRTGADIDDVFGAFAEVVEDHVVFLERAVADQKEQRERKIDRARAEALIPDLPTLRRIDRYRSANENSLRRKLEVFARLKELAHPNP